MQSMIDPIHAEGDTYEQAYRRLHPRRFPYSSHERQLELRDLWPSEQAKFRKLVDAVVRVS